MLGRGGDHHHFAPMQTAGHFVQVGKASGHASQHALPLVVILDRVDRLLDQVFDVVWNGPARATR